MSDFKQALHNNNWNDIFEVDDVNKTYNSFINDFTRLHELCFPLKRVRVDKKCNEKPWMTKGLINACKKKNSLYRIFIKIKHLKSEIKYKKYKNN